MARPNELTDMAESNKSLILVANPGSASRKYALYNNGKCISEIHFEWEDNKIVCTVSSVHEEIKETVGETDLKNVVKHVYPMLLRAGVFTHDDKIRAIGLRIVAPSGFFLQNHHITPSVETKLKELEQVSPLHIAIVLEELAKLQHSFEGIPIYGISDSAFHKTKPVYAWNYAIPLEDADKYEIKRYGFHGLSVQSSVRHLRRQDKMASKVIVAHLGSGASVSALHGGKSLDNSMGYSPLDGTVMATRSGSIDFSAVRALQIKKSMRSEEIEVYLNKKSGLLGLGGSPDIRELLAREDKGDERAYLALSTYVYSVQKSIAQMTAALGGVDALVFTGTVGERSSTIRKRIVDRLHYLDFILDSKENAACQNPHDLEVIHYLVKSKPVYVVHADEAAEIAKQVEEML